MTIIKLLRPRQWIKNLFIFPAIIFSKEFMIKDSPVFALNYFNILMLLLLFVIFSIVSSMIYIINDIIDRDEDKLHPKKRTRPIASGLISVKSAIIVFFILFAVTAALFFLINLQTKIIIALYFILNIFYSLYLKKQPVIDIFVISLGFLLRSIAGAAVINTVITNWFLITIFMISLTIACIKRRGEYSIKEQGRRSVLKYYNLEILDIFVALSSISALITYCIFALTYEIKSFYITIPLILFGMMRYLFLSYTDKEKSGSPDELITTDLQIIIAGILYVISVFVSMFILH